MVLFLVTQVRVCAADPRHEDFLFLACVSIWITDTNCESMASRCCGFEEYSAEGVREVTSGITDLWQPFYARCRLSQEKSITNFLCDAAAPNCRIVEASVGNTICSSDRSETYYF